MKIQLPESLLNRPPRYLAIGDIHGCYQAFSVLLDAVQLRADDVLIPLGDYVDRGPASHAVIDRLIDLSKNYSCYPLIGNHEIMMLQARHLKGYQQQWLMCGGQETLDSYSHIGGPGKMIDVPDEHWEFLEQRLHRWVETDTHFCVHANALSDLPLDDQPDWVLFWEKFNHPERHCSGKIMVCGHTIQSDRLPFSTGNAICLDTGSYKMDGWITCCELTSGDYWQANQNGETREGSLIE